MCINVIFQTVSFYITVMQSRSVTFLFMCLGEPLQYYQSSNNLPESAQTLDFSLLTNCLCLNLKSCFVLRNTSSRSAGCRLVSVSIFLAFVVAQHLESHCSLTLLTCLDCLNLSCRYNLITQRLIARKLTLK